MAEIDMTKPQPCTVFQYAPKTAASTLAWVAKLDEETGEAIREALKVSRLAESVRHGFMRSAMTNICAARCSGA